MVDLSNKNSLTSFISQNTDELREISSKAQLVAFIERGKSQGFYVSDRKLAEMKMIIGKKPNFIEAHQYVYRFLCSGLGMPANI